MVSEASNSKALFVGKCSVRALSAVPKPVRVGNRLHRLRTLHFPSLPELENQAHVVKLQFPARFESGKGITGPDNSFLQLVFILKRKLPRPSCLLPITLVFETSSTGRSTHRTRRAQDQVACLPCTPILKCQLCRDAKAFPIRPVLANETSVPG